nr:hypothetical protein Itr_chr01CG10610 [Ipomoea trifida]
MRKRTAPSGDQAPLPAGRLSDQQNGKQNNIPRTECKTSAGRRRDSDGVGRDIAPKHRGVDYPVTTDKAARNQLRVGTGGGGPGKSQRCLRMRPMAWEVAVVRVAGGRGEYYRIHKSDRSP